MCLKALLILFSFLYIFSAIDFVIDVDPKKEVCFREDLFNHTLYVIEINSIQKQIDFTLLVEQHDDDPVRKALYSDKKTGKILYSETTLNHTSIMFCIVHKMNKSNRFHVKFVEGIFANDFSQSAKKNHFKPVVGTILNIDHTIKKLIQDSRERSIKGAENLTTLIISFGVLTIICILILTFSLIYYIGTFLKERKLI